MFCVAVYIHVCTPFVNLLLFVKTVEFADC